MQIDHKKLQSYLFLIILIVAILLGSMTGYWLGDKAVVLKPLGDIFLNLMFTVVVPLVFFSISAAIASMGELKQVWKVISNMFLTFIFTGIVAAAFMIFVVKLFPPAQGVFLKLPQTTTTTAQLPSVGEQIVNIFTVSDFMKLFSRENILALIFFSGLVGLATTTLGRKRKLVNLFLQAGTEISMKAVSYVMYYAPIGFFAYFAVLVGELGPKLLESYFRATLIYYSSALLYFIVGYSFYAYLALKTRGIKIFWKNSLVPIMTSLATCSSAASIPANLYAARTMGIPKEVFETVIPIGAILHKDGSTLGGIVKIAFLFGIFHMNFSGLPILLTALLVGLLVGTVMGAIPSGGMVAEVLILSLYGFPPQALIVIAAITILIDPPATMLNVLGNSVCSMLAARLVVGKNRLISQIQGEAAK
ncbi:MAG TPA: dicarboxylate/amino acid:cation symporter [Gammaproteobacteria bacterium]|nr:dicarboxylate/amino acid:cation symporter [Gammaproteobacteria bacterium]